MNNNDLKSPPPLNLAASTAAGDAVERSCLTADRAFFILSPENCVRRGAVYLTTKSTIYSFVLLLAIFLNAGLLALRQPEFTLPPAVVTGAYYGEITFLSLFLLDIVVRSVAQGFILHERAALRDPWTVFSAVIVTFSFMSFFGTSSGLNLSGLLALAPLRAVGHARSFRALSSATAVALPMILATMLFMTLFVALFALIGVDLWANEEHNRRCGLPIAVPNLRALTRQHCGNVSSTTECDAFALLKATFLDFSRAVPEKDNEVSSLLASLMSNLDAHLPPRYRPSASNATAQHSEDPITLMPSELLQLLANETASSLSSVTLANIWYPLVTAINATWSLMCSGRTAASSPLWSHSGGGGFASSSDDALPMCTTVIVDDPFDSDMCGGFHSCAAPFECIPFEGRRDADRVTLKRQLSWPRRQSEATNSTPSNATGTEKEVRAAEQFTGEFVFVAAADAVSDPVATTLRSNRLRGTARSRNTNFRFDNLLKAMLMAFSIITRDNWSDDYDRFVQVNGFYTYPYFILLSLLGRFFLLNTVISILLCEYSAASNAIEEADAAEREREAALASSGVMNGDGNINGGDGVKRLRIGGAASVDDGSDPILGKKSAFANDPEDRFFAELTDPAAPQSTSRSIKVGVYAFLDRIVKPFNHFLTFLNILALLIYFNDFDAELWRYIHWGSMGCTGFIPIELLLRLLCMGPVLTFTSVYNWIDIAICGNLAYELLYEVTTGVAALRGFRLIEGIYRHHRHAQLMQLREQIADEKRNAKQVHKLVSVNGSKGPSVVTRLVAFNSDVFKDRGSRKRGGIAAHLDRPLPPGNIIVRVAMLFYSLVPAMFSVTQVLVVMAVIVYTYAIIGMQLFGEYDLRDRNGDLMRTNFRSLWNSCYTLFAALNCEWSDVFLAAADVDQAGMGFAIIVYMFTFYLLHMFIVLNIMMSVFFAALDVVVEEEWETENFFLNEATDVATKFPPRLILPPITYLDVIQRGGRAAGEKKTANSAAQRGYDGGSAAQGVNLAGIDVKWPQLMFRNDARKLDARRPPVVLQGTSLKLFGPANPFRKFLARVMFSKPFGLLTHFVTFLNLTFLTLQSTPGSVDWLLDWGSGISESDVVVYFTYIGYGITAMFFLEVFVKVIVLGGFYPDGESLRRDGKLVYGRSERLDMVFTAFGRTWLNNLSVLIALSSVLSIWFPVMKFGRSLRIVSFVSRFNGVRIAFLSLGRSLPYIARVVVMGVLVWVLLAIIGTHIFAGKMHRCNDPSVLHRSECVGTFLQRQLDRDALVDAFRGATDMSAGASLTVANASAALAERMGNNWTAAAGFVTTAGSLLFADTLTLTNLSLASSGLEEAHARQPVAATSEASRFTSLSDSLSPADHAVLASLGTALHSKLYRTVEVPRRWIIANPVIAFDNAAQSLLTVFISATAENIRDLIYACIDATSANRVGIHNFNIWGGIYAVGIIVAGNYFVINAICGVPISCFTKFRKLLDGTLYLSEAQLMYYYSQKVIEGTMFLLDNSERPLNPIRRAAFNIAYYTPSWLKEAPRATKAASTQKGPSAAGSKYVTTSPQQAVASPSANVAASGLPTMTAGEPAAEKPKVRFMILGDLSLFDFVINCVIVINCTIQFLLALQVEELALGAGGSGGAVSTSIKMVRHSTTVIFVIEALIRIVALGWSRYAAQRSNTFDFVVALLNFVDLVLLLVGIRGSYGTLIGATAAEYADRFFSFADLLKIVRLHKVLRRIARVQKIFALISYSSGPIMNVIVLFVCCIYVSSMLAVDLFGKIAPNTVITSDRNNNFKSLPNAANMLYQITTLARWSQVMVACMVSEPDCSEADGTCGRPYISIPFFVCFTLFVSIFMVQLCISAISDTFWVLEKIALGREKIFEIFTELRVRWVAVAETDVHRASIREMNCVNLCRFIRRVPVAYIETLNIVDLAHCTRRARTESERQQDERDARAMTELDDDGPLVGAHDADGHERDAGRPRVPDDNRSNSSSGSVFRDDAQKGGASGKGANVVGQGETDDFDFVLTNVDVLRIVEALHLTVSRKKDATAANGSVASTPPDDAAEAAVVTLVGDSAAPPSGGGGGNLTLLQHCSYFVSFESVLFAMLRAWCRSPSPGRALCHLPIFAELTRYDDAYPGGGPGKRSGGVEFAGSNFRDGLFTAAHVLAARFIWNSYRRWKKLVACGKLPTREEREQRERERLAKIHRDLLEREERLAVQKRPKSFAEAYAEQQKKNAAHASASTAQVDATDGDAARRLSEAFPTPTPAALGTSGRREAWGAPIDSQPSQQPSSPQAPVWEQHQQHSRADYSTDDAENDVGPRRKSLLRRRSRAWVDPNKPRLGSDAVGSAFEEPVFYNPTEILNPTSDAASAAASKDEADIRRRDSALKRQQEQEQRRKSFVTALAEAESRHLMSQKNRMKSKVLSGIDLRDL